MRFYLR